MKTLSVANFIEQTFNHTTGDLKYISGEGKIFLAIVTNTIIMERTILYNIYSKPEPID